MPKDLEGTRIAFLATDGVEQIELTQPWAAAKDAGAVVELVSPKQDRIQGMNLLDKSDTFEVDVDLAGADARDYDGLVLPGGVANPDFLRLDERAVAFVGAFFEQGKPTAAICHGPWMLVEAAVLEDRTVTSWPSLQTDIENAGATWLDEEVINDEGLVTSRKPDDLPAFCAEMIKQFADAREQRRAS